VVSSGAATGQHLGMPCILTLIRGVLDVVLGPEEQIAYVTVTTR
jgi:hypothetical protein